MNTENLAIKPYLSALKELNPSESAEFDKIFRQANTCHELTTMLDEKYSTEVAFIKSIQPFIQTSKLKTIAGWVTFLGLLVLLGIIVSIIMVAS